MAGLWVTLRQMRSRAMSSSPGASSGPEHQAWSSGVLLCPRLRGWLGSGPAGTRCWCLALPGPGLSVLSPVAQVADSCPQSTASQIRPCVLSYLTCLALGLSVASLHLSGVPSSVPSSRGRSPCPHLCVFLCICPCQSRGPGGPIVSSPFLC